MHNIIERGKALYWGTSEWSADEIRAAWDIADRRNLHKPVMEQPQYNLLHRKRVENEYARLYEDIGLGLTTWSPLASGLLSGKYRNGIPAGSRGTLESYAFLRESLTDPTKNAVVGKLETVAEDLGCTLASWRWPGACAIRTSAQELGCTLAQLALAWCLRNPRVSSVITGATRVEQVRENMQALDVVRQADARRADDASARSSTRTPAEAAQRALSNDPCGRCRPP